MAALLRAPEAPDPGKTCSSCANFHGQECRAFAPRAEPSPNRADALWPLVKAGDFCIQDWKRR